MCMQVLSLSNNLLGFLPDSLVDLTKLVDLDVSHNQLRELPDDLDKLINLKNLNVGMNNLSKLPDTITGLINIERIHLSKNRLASLPEELGVHMPHLRVLVLAYNEIKRLPLAMWHATSLQVNWPGIALVLDRCISTLA